MAWSTPPAFVTATTVTAAQLNILSDDLTAIGGAWTPYIPTLTNITLGNGTLTFKYLSAGKLTKVRGRFAAGSTTSYSAGTLGFSAPVTPHADYTSGAAVDWGVGSGTVMPVTRQGATVVFATTAGGVFNFIVDNLASNTLTTNLIPGTFSTGSVIAFTAEYEAA